MTNFSLVDTLKTCWKLLASKGVKMRKLDFETSNLLSPQAAQEKGACSACSAYINLFQVPHILSNRQNIRVYMGMKQIPLKLLQIRNSSK